MVKVLIGCTGSVATIKLPLLLETFFKEFGSDLQVRVIVTEHAKHFCALEEVPEKVNVFSDSDEWNVWSKRGDPVLHIDLAKWADVFLLAPLDANTLAKIANGLCDNLLTCAVRAWDLAKPLLFCPAMNTKMYEHPSTSEHVGKLLSWGYHLIPVTEKVLVCGDKGVGAMAEICTIVDHVRAKI